MDASSASLVVGVKKGSFQKHGVDATLKVFPSAQEALESVLIGQVDTTANGPFNISPVAARSGARVPVVAAERLAVNSGLFDRFGGRNVACSAGNV